MNRRDAYISRKAASALKQRLIGVAVIAAVAGLALVGLLVEPEHAIAARGASVETPAPTKTVPVPVAAEPAPALVAAPRRVYPFSIIPGGVSGKEELASVIKVDKVVAAHYVSFDVDKAFALTVQKPRAVYVSYRKGDQVYWTSRKLMLVKGETLLSDGRHEMRARCANRISDTPQFPVEANEPSAEELDSVMAVSMDPADLGLDDGAGRGFGPGLGPAGSEAGSANIAGRASADMGPGSRALAARPASGRATILGPGPSDVPPAGATPETPVPVPPPQSNNGDQGTPPAAPPLAGGGTPGPAPSPAPGPLPELSPPPSGAPAPPSELPPADIPPAEIPGTPLPPPPVPEPPVFPPSELPQAPGEPEHDLPEPGTLGLFAAAFAGLLLLRRKPARSKR